MEKKTTTQTVEGASASNNVNPLIQNPDGSPKWQNPTTVIQRGDSYGIPYTDNNPVGMITSDRTYASRENAVKALRKVFGDDFPNVRWLIAVKPDGRFVPTVLGTGYVWAAHHGIMVIA